jgi:tetratricopeptide (TPR) repeat protein
LEDASGLFSKLLEIEQNPTARARLLKKKAACWVAEKLGKGDNSEAKSLLDQALSLEDADRKEIAQALIAKGEIQINDGNLAAAWETCAMAERICREIGDDYSTMKVLDLSVFINLSTGEVKAAIGPAKECMALASKHGSPRDRLSSYSSMSQVMMHIGDWKESIAWCDKCVEVAERFRDYGSLAWTHLSMANVYLYSREYNKAFEDAIKCYGFASKIGSDFLMSRSMAQMAMSDVHLGKLDKAMEEARTALAHDANMNWRGPPRCGVINLMKAEIACAGGEWEVAEPLYRQSLAEWKENAYSAQHKAFELRQFGEILLKNGKREEGVRILEEAIHLYAKLGDDSDMAIARELMNTALNE